MNRNIHGPAALARILCVAIVLTSIAFQADATTFIGIYADKAHTECSSYPGLYQAVNYWVWIQPGEDGMMCVDYEITTPANVIEAATTVNPAAGYHIGNAIVPPGATVCFATCQTDWIWTNQLTCLVTAAIPSVITLDPHDDYGIMRVTTCAEPEPVFEEMTKINDMFLFQGCCLSTEESSWGAIKSLMK